MGIIYRKQQAAELLGISLRLLDYWIAQKRIRIVKVGRTVLIEEDEINKFLDDHRSDSN